MSYLSVGTVPVQLDGLNSALSPVVYGDIALSIKIHKYTKYTQISVLGLSLLILKRISGFVLILRSINPSIIIIVISVCNLGVVQDAFTTRWIGFPNFYVHGRFKKKCLKNLR